jgi:hypothetical protein
MTSKKNELESLMKQASNNLGFGKTKEMVLEKKEQPLLLGSKIHGM